MRVFINAASSGLGGALTYMTNLLRELPGVSTPGDRFFVVVPGSKMDFLDKVADNETTELIPFSARRAKVLERLYFDNWTVPRLVRERNIDTLFSCTGFATLRRTCPQVLLVRNSLYFSPLFQRQCSEIKGAFHFRRLRRWHSLLSIGISDLVVFPTRAMREMVARYIAVPKESSAVLRYGFSSRSFFQKESAKPEIAEKMERWRDDGYKILLNVSHYGLHKNFETVIEALRLVIDSGVQIKFVCTLSNRLLTPGSLYRRQYDSLLSRQRDLNLSNTVEHSGDFDYSQVHYLYERADLFVFPSFTESFGHPLVEAMSCGLPIVASDTAVNRELCGTAAKYFHTFDPGSCASVVMNTLRDADLRREISIRGLERSKDFSWAEHAASLLELLRHVANKG